MKFNLLILLFLTPYISAQEIERVRVELKIANQEISGYIDRNSINNLSQTIAIYPDTPQMIQQLLALVPSPLISEGTATTPAELRLNTKHKIKAVIDGKTYAKKKVKCRGIRSFCDQVLEGKTLFAELLNKSTPVQVYQSYDNRDEDLIRKMYFVFHGKRMLYAQYEEQSLKKLIKILNKKTRFKPSLKNKSSDQIVELIDQYNAKF